MGSKAQNCLLICSCTHYCADIIAVQQMKAVLRSSTWSRCGGVQMELSETSLMVDLFSLFRIVQSCNYFMMCLTPEVLFCRDFYLGPLIDILKIISSGFMIFMLVWSSRFNCFSYDDHMVCRMVLLYINQYVAVCLLSYKVASREQRYRKREM